jgi:23S rRNA pseudouridine955/2504/2580 synthase
VAGTSEAGARLDRFVRRRFRRLPAGLLHKLARRGRITVNGQRCEPASRLRAGDRVELWEDLSRFEVDPVERLRQAERLRSTAGFQRHFRVLHEDEHLIALDKPAGLVVHPSREHRKGDTLLDLLRTYLPETFEAVAEFRPAFVHRLDRGTSGVIVAAKTRDSAKRLERAFREGEVRKTYVALVHGAVRGDGGEIDLSLRKEREGSGPTRTRVAQGVAAAASARPARTLWRVLERFEGATLLSLEPATGRMHQIRVHLAALGHPLAGDGDYGARGLDHRFRELHGLRRLFLHAAEIELPRPQDVGTLRLEAALPGDLEAVLRSLRAGRGASDQLPALFRRRPRNSKRASGRRLNQCSRSEWEPPQTGKARPRAAHES